MLFFFEIMFLILGFCSLGMALYYGKKNGVIKVFHEVKNLEAMDEVQNSTGDEYGYEDEIYGEVTSADLRKAREDESSELSDREKRRKREENKRKENKPEIKQEKKKRMFNLNDSEAETDLIRRNIFEQNTNKESEQKQKEKEKKDVIINNKNNDIAEEETVFMESERSLGNGDFSPEEETGFMRVPDFDTSEDKETAFMESSSTGKEVYDGEEETGFMGSEEEETSFMGVSNKKNSDSPFLVADESALDSHAERFCGDALVFADEEETVFMNDSSVFVDNNEEETGFMGACPVSRNSAYSKDSDSDFADEEETGFMSSAMSSSQTFGKKKKNAETRENTPKENAGNMESGSEEIPVSENIRSFIEEEDEEETGFMRKEEIMQSPTATSRTEEEEETSFMGVSLD